MKSKPAAIHEYIADYVEDRMELSTKEVFEEYLNQNKNLHSFVIQSKRGMILLRGLPRLKYEGIIFNSKTNDEPRNTTDALVTRKKQESFLLISLGITAFVTGLALTQQILGK